MYLTIKKWGNSQGVILPKMLLDSLGFGVDDDLKVDVENNKIVLSRPKEKVEDFSDLILEDLLQKGYEGEKLLSEFRRIKGAMPKALNSMKMEMLKEYEDGEMVEYEDFFND